MLQTHGVSVRDCLLRLNTTDFDTPVECARLLWPPFIAAGEVEDVAVQTSFA